MGATTLELIRGATVLDISDESNFIHESHSGFGMPPLRRLMEQGPQQHGATDRGMRLQPRVVDLSIPLVGQTWDHQWAQRQQIHEMLSVAGEDPVYLRLTLPGGQVRQLTCYPLAGPDFGTGSMWGAGSAFRAVFQLVAPDPTWYDPVGHSITFLSDTGSGSWRVGSGSLWKVGSGGWTVGGSSISKEQAVVYPGSWDSTPDLIRLTGPLNDPVLLNVITGDVLDFTGAIIDPGDYYDIDLRFGYKTVLDSSGANQISKLTPDSDLATWRIAASPYAPGGVNVIRFSATNTTTASRVDINYLDRFFAL